MNHPRPTCRTPSLFAFAVPLVLAALAAGPACAAGDSPRSCSDAAAAGILAPPAPPGDTSRVAPGIVVESVEAGSTLAQAGLAGGDLILRWERPAQGPVAKSGATRQGKAGGGAIGSPFDWWWLAAEQAPRGPLTLRGCRGRQPLRLRL